MATFTGRQKEIKILEEINRSEEAELLTIYGRRRVGKTYLISQFFKDKGLYFELTGTKDASMQEQLINFAGEMSRVFYQGERSPAAGNWTEAFTQLKNELEKRQEAQKIILFFDELPWLATPKSGFLQALEHLWNRHLSRKKNIVLIICGSLASWMIENVIHNKGGLHGRVTQKIRLLPFNLLETEEFLKAHHIHFDRKQLVELYMAMGGIPQYLKYVKRGKSVAQIINDVCFSPNGFLFDEFEKLYRSLYDNYQVYINIIKALAKRPSGFTMNELLREAGLESGGTASRIIESLEQAGFISYIPEFGKKKIGGRYRLIDEYSLFYLTWIAAMPKTSLEGIDEGYWIKKRGSRSWAAWSGYAFESICLKHVGKIKEALGISGVSTIESEWFSKGAQIDLVIDRADHCINLCEIKYNDSEFVIDKDYAKVLENKKRVFRETTGTKKTLLTTMITTHGVKKNTHSLAVVDCALVLDDLFR